MGERVFIALGSNLGDRSGYLAYAIDAIAALEHVEVLGVSGVEETEHVGPTAQPRYLNQMIAVSTTLEPLALLDALQAIEAKAGRERQEHWGARTLDLDIVRFGSRRLSHPRLTVPHPQLARRPFWQRELDELHTLTRRGPS